MSEEEWRQRHPFPQKQPWLKVGADVWLIRSGSRGALAYPVTVVSIYRRDKWPTYSVRFRPATHLSKPAPDASQVHYVRPGTPQTVFPTTYCSWFVRTEEEATDVVFRAAVIAGMPERLNMLSTEQLVALHAQLGGDMWQIYRRVSRLLPEAEASPGASES